MRDAAWNRRAEHNLTAGLVSDVMCRRSNVELVDTDAG
jgi:hypothetical protein